MSLCLLVLQGASSIVKLAHLLNSDTKRKQRLRNEIKTKEIIEKIMADKPKWFDPNFLVVRDLEFHHKKRMQKQV